jgi:hypothetical protein
MAVRGESHQPARKKAVNAVYRLSVCRIRQRFDSAIQIGEDQEQRFNSGNFEQFHDAIVHSGQDDLLSSFLAGNISAN